MVGRTKRWIIRKLELGEFASRRQVVLRSAIMAGRIAFIAYAMNVGLHFLLYWAGLMPYDLVAALILATALTPGVSFVVAFAAYYVVGMAVFELSVARGEFERISRVDPLSGLLNRRAFMDIYNTATDKAALVLFDLDKFKAINDTYGHGVGDEVIVAVAEELSHIFRNGHVVARFGGEEFVVLLRGISDRLSCDLVENACQSVSDRVIRTVDGDLSFTVSAGVGEAHDGLDFRELFADADKALYLAKALGRNRVVSARDLAALQPKKEVFSDIDAMVA
jgi:diguanylate cyclase (GGDEF)-like protein